MTNVRIVYVNCDEASGLQLPLAWLRAAVNKMDEL